MAEIEAFANVISDALQETAEEIEEITREEITLISKEALKTLRNHPNIPQKTGAYKKSFALKKSVDKKGELKYTLHNREPEYRKAHLLEYGHAKKDGGRVRAYPHWRDAQKVVDELPQRIKRRVESGT